jgi:hypothetical protein
VIPEAVMERAMKIQEVILRAMAKRITWWQAAEILGLSDRQMRRWHRRYQKWGYDGLWDRRRGRPARDGCPWSWPSTSCSFTGRSISISMCATFTRSCASSTVWRSATAG